MKKKNWNLFLLNHCVSHNRFDDSIRCFFTKCFFYFMFLFSFLIEFHNLLLKIENSRIHLFFLFKFCFSLSKDLFFFFHFIDGQWSVYFAFEKELQLILQSIEIISMTLLTAIVFLLFFIISMLTTHPFKMKIGILMFFFF